MVNILLSLWTLNDEYLKDELSKYILPDHKVAIISFCHKSCEKEQYELRYGLAGKHYLMPVEALTKYGIKKSNISLVHYFNDSAQEMKNKIQSSDILLFTGGMPDLAIDRFKEKQIFDNIMNYNGVIIGYSAGALLQLEEYFLSPDDDYPELTYKNGLGIINNNYYIEVHYEDNKEWHNLLQNIADEKNKTIYALGNHCAIITDQQKKMKLLGDVIIFQANKI